MLKNLKIKSLRSYGIVVIGLMGVVMSGAVKGVDAYIPTQYENIGLEELISTYKHAYSKAGFRYKKETVGSAGSRGKTELYFEFSISKFPNNNGIVYVEFSSCLLVSEKKIYTPCYVTKGWDLSASKVHGAEYDLFVEKMKSADNMAISEIENKLLKFDTNRAERKRHQDLQRFNNPPGLH